MAAVSQCPAAGNGDDGKQLPEAVYELQWNHADALELQCVSGRDRKRFVLYHLCSDPGRSAAGGTGKCVLLPQTPVCRVYHCNRSFYADAVTDRENGIFFQCIYLFGGVCVDRGHQTSADRCNRPPDETVTGPYGSVSGRRTDCLRLYAAGAV